MDNVEKVEHEVETIQQNLGGLVGELDHRRKELFDLRLQLRRHAVPLIVAGSALFVLIAAGITTAVIRRRRQRTLRARAGRLREALRRMTAHPDQVAEASPHVGKKIASAGGSAAASVIGKKLAQRLLRA
jgi:hypothetical protein